MAYPPPSRTSSYPRQPDHHSANTRWTTLPSSGNSSISLFPSPPNSSHVLHRDSSSSIATTSQPHNTVYSETNDYRSNLNPNPISSPSRASTELSGIEHMAQHAESSPSRIDPDHNHPDTPQSAIASEILSGRRSTPLSHYLDHPLSFQSQLPIQQSGTPSSTYGSEETTDETSIHSPSDSTTRTGSSTTLGPLHGSHRHSMMDFDGRIDTSTPPPSRMSTASPANSSSSSVPTPMTTAPSTGQSGATGGYERKPRKAKGPSRPVGRPPILRTHAPTRVPVNLLPTLYEGLLKHLNQSGRDEYDKYAIQALVISMAMQDEDEELTGDEQSRYSSLFQQCLKTVQDDTLSRYKLTARRKNGRIDGDSDASRDKKVVERYHELLDSNKYRVERLYRNSEAAVHYVWTRDDFIRFKEAFRKFGYAPTANRQIADYVGKGMHPNHIQYFKRALKQRLGGSMIRDLIESPAYNALIAAAPVDDGRGLADYLPPQEDPSVDVGTKVLFGSAVGGSFFGSSTTTTTTTPQGSQSSKPPTASPPASAPPASTTAAPSAAPKKRGRPPKPKPPVAVLDGNQMDTSGNASSTVPASIPANSPPHSTANASSIGGSPPKTRPPADGNPLFQRLQAAAASATTSTASTSSTQAIGPPAPQHQHAPLRQSESTTTQQHTGRRQANGSSHVNGDSPSASNGSTHKATADKNFLDDMAAFGLTAEDLNPAPYVPSSARGMGSTTTFSGAQALGRESTAKRTSNDMVNPTLDGAPAAKRKAGPEAPAPGIHSLPLNPAPPAAPLQSNRMAVDPSVPQQGTNTSTWPGQTPNAHTSRPTVPPANTASHPSAPAQPTHQASQMFQGPGNASGPAPQATQQTAPPPVSAGDFSLPAGSDPMAMLAHLMQHTAQLTQMVQRLSSNQASAPSQGAAAPPTPEPTKEIPQEAQNFQRAQQPSQQQHAPRPLQLSQQQQQQQQQQAQQQASNSSRQTPGFLGPSTNTAQSAHSGSMHPLTHKSLEPFNRPAPPAGVGATGGAGTLPSWSSITEGSSSSLSSPRQSNPATMLPPHHQHAHQHPQLGALYNYPLHPQLMDHMAGSPSPAQDRLQTANTPLYPILPSSGLAHHLHQPPSLQMQPPQSAHTINHQANPYSGMYYQPQQTVPQLPAMAPQPSPTMSQQQMQQQMHQQYLLAQRQLQTRFPAETSGAIEDELLAFDDYPTQSRGPHGPRGM